MQIEVMIFTLFIQMAIQLSLYFSTIKIVSCIIDKPIRLVSWGHWILGLKRQELTNGLVSVSMIMYNIALSLLVLKFTSTSALAGITNLGASVAVGIFMGMHFRKGGKYYIKTEERHPLQALVNKLKRK